METKLSENTTERINETIVLYRVNRKLLEAWKVHLMGLCKACTASYKYYNSCDCDVQSFLDTIIELLNGNGGNHG